MWMLRLVIAICLFLALRSFGVAWAVLDQLDLYQAVQAAGAWQLRVVIHLTWAISFLALALGFWRRDQRAYRAFIPLLCAYALVSFGWLAFFAQSTYDRGRIPSVGVTSVVGVGLAYWLKVRLHKFFNGDVNEHS